MVVAAGNDASLVGTRTSCTHFPFSIGRASSNDLSIPGDPALSRTHAFVDRDDTGFLVRDASTNGIYVNGRLLRGGGESLRIGATISLSRTTAVRFVSDIPELPELVGSVISGRFRLEEKLHSSVKSSTYRARDQRLPRDVILKIFSPALMKLSQYHDEYRQQGEVAARLQHTNICSVIDIGDTTLTLRGKNEKVVFICTECMTGGSLSQRLSASSQEELPIILAWIRQIAFALAHAHREGIVHGDIKPACIVFDRNGTPYVSDFALARASGSSTSSTIVGAPDYLSPEQWEGKAPTSASDQYSLAVIAYLAITGSLPHERQDDPIVRERNFRRGAVPAHVECIARGRKPPPESVSLVLEKALSVDAHARYTSIDVFANALEEAATRSTSSKRVPRIFLSYQRQSSAPWALMFARDLEEKFGFSVFVDTRAMDGAPRIPDRLRDEIKQCDVFACFLTSSTLESSWVRQEIELAVQHGRPMIPIFQEDFVPAVALQLSDRNVDQLLAHQHVFLFDRRNVHVTHSIADLAERIRAILIS